MQAQHFLQLDQTRLRCDTLVQDLDIPWEILWGPNNRIWYTERLGRVSQLDPQTGQKTLMLDLRGQLYQQSESGLLGMALHPHFDQSPQVFLVYTYTSSSVNRERLVRYDYANDSLINPFILVDNIRAAGIHNGARLLFLPDTTLLMSTGDAGNTSYPQDSSSLNGKILRLHTDGRIPTDNPFPGSLVYSLGWRNAQGLCRLPNGLIYASEHGPTTDDEFQIVHAGRNYGWPTVAGYCNLAAEQTFCQSHQVVEPLRAWTPTIAPSDLLYYNSAHIPEWQGKILMTVLKEGTLVSLELNANGDSLVQETTYFNAQFGRLRDICTDPQGNIYLATNGSSWSNTSPNTHCIVRLSVDGIPISGIEAEAGQAPAFELFPNPNQGFWQIRWPQTQVGAWQLFNSQGQMLRQGRLEPGLQNVQAQDLPAGLYFFRSLDSQGLTQTQRLIIQAK